jgi:hypothetical protein
MPTSTSRVQAIMSLQLVGHLPAPLAMPVSQTSPLVTTPSPHEAEQSESVATVAPGGQQPSPAAGVVMGVFVQAAVHVPPPMSASLVHAAPSLQLVGQLPAPLAMPVSQVSPISTRLLPHITMQSLSESELAAGGQQPSPSAGLVIGVVVHVASHSVPTSVSLCTPCRRRSSWDSCRRRSRSRCRRARRRSRLRLRTRACRSCCSRRSDPGCRRRTPRRRRSCRRRSGSRAPHRASRRCRAMDPCPAQALCRAPYRHRWGPPCPCVARSHRRDRCHLRGCPHRRPTWSPSRTPRARGPTARRS